MGVVAETKCLHVYIHNSEFFRVFKVNGQKLDQQLYLVQVYEGYTTVYWGGITRERGAAAEAVLTALKTPENRLSSDYGLGQIKDDSNAVLCLKPDRAIAAYDKKPTVSTTTDGLDICFFRRKFISTAQGFGEHFVTVLEAEAMRETQARIGTRYQIHPSWPYGIIRLRSAPRADAPVMKTFEDPQKNTYFRFIIDNRKSTSDFWFVSATTSGMSDKCKTETECNLWVIKRYEGHLTLSPVQIATVVLLDSIIGSSCKHKGRCDLGCPYGFHRNCGYKLLPKHKRNLQTMYKILEDAHRKPTEFDICLEMKFTYKGEYEDGYIPSCKP